MQKQAMLIVIPVVPFGNTAMSNAMCPFSTCSSNQCTSVTNISHKTSKPNQGWSNYKEPLVILYTRRKGQDKKATPAARYSVHPWSVTNDKTMNKTILNYTQEMLSTTIRLVKRCGTWVAHVFSCAVGLPKCMVLVISVVPSKYFNTQNSVNWLYY